MKIIKYLIMGGIFLIPLTPLIVTKSLFFPFITGKNFFFRFLIEILAGLWLILAIYDKRYRPRKSWILIFFVSFIFILVLSSIFGENLYHSFWSNYERMEGLVTYLHLFAYFLILTTVLNTEKLWKWFFHISLGVSVIIAIYGILQLAGKLEIHQGGVRLDATLGNASYLAIYIVFHIFLAFWYFLKEKEWYRWFYVPVMALEIFILYHTATRGAILGFMGGMILSAFLIGLLSESKRTKAIAISSFVLIFIIMGIFWVFRSSNFVRESPVLSRFAEISLEETTTQSRFVVWKMSWGSFKEKPIFGWGPENYNLVFNKYYEPILYRQEPWFDRAHNVFFDRLTTNGLFGLLTYLGLFGSAVYYLLLQRKKYGFSVYDSSILISLLAAYFFHNLFVFDNIVSLLLFFSFLGYIHSRISISEPSANQTKDTIIKNDYKKTSLASIVIIAIVFLIYFINVPALLACHGTLTALKEAGMGNYKVSFEKFRNVIAYDSFGTAEAREQLVSFAANILSQKNIDPDLRAKIVEKASDEMKKQIEESPNDIRYMIFLGSLYNSAQRYNEAIDIIEKAIVFSPKKQQLYFELGTSYLNKKDYEKAKEVLRTAFELEPSFANARIIYAASLIFAGDFDLAEKILREQYGTDIISDERLIRAYAEKGKFDKVAAIWEKIIEQNPNNAQYHVSLAASYLQIGQREKSIEHLQKAIEIEPKFKQQGEYYINEIRAGRNP